MQTQKFPKISLAAARCKRRIKPAGSSQSAGCQRCYAAKLRIWENRTSMGTVQKIERVYKFPADFIFIHTFALSEQRANSAALPYQQQLRLPTTSASALMTLWSIPSSYNHSTTTPVP